MVTLPALLIAAAGASDLPRTDAPNPDHIRADTAFLVHIDFERAASTDLGELAIQSLYEGDDTDWLREITTHLDIEFGEDIHALTVYGADDDEPVFLLYGSRALDRWAEALDDERGDRAADRLDGRTLYEIQLDDDDASHAVILKRGRQRLWILGESRHALAEAIDTIEEEDDALDMDHWPVSGPESGAYIYVGVRDLDAIEAWAPASDIARRASGFAVSFGEHEGDAFIRAEVTARDESEAEAIVQIAEGLWALGRLIGREDPDFRAFIDFLGEIHLESNGRVIGASFQHDADEVREFLAEHLR